MRLRVLLFLSFMLFFTAESHASITVVGNLAQQSVMLPGETHEGIITLRNLGTEPSEVRVYQTDYSFSSDGKTLYGTPGESPRSNAGWIIIQPNRMTISPGTTAPVYYTIKVPEDPELIGTFWSIVMVEEISNTSPESSNQSRSVGIQAVMRYGVQLITEIADTGTNSLKFLDRQYIISEDGTKTFQIDLENNGEKWYIPDLMIEVYDSSGNNVEHFEGSNRRIFPGCSVRHLIDITSLPAGKYKFLVIVDTGDENVYGAEYDLEL
ncbi:hypothetical protein ACFL6K_03355 [Candidatus Latescibacterota bacterium]